MADGMDNKQIETTTLYSFVSEQFDDLEACCMFSSQKTDNFF